ncbi:MAG TPA: ankyrin repeat domain-containing protein [Daejeonella sp.]|uniref:ankyrin repeat domain-containing protein n=1 Tax=Daejeonella sp. TaxID=2805397 RepID=UPI002ED94A33
MDQDLLEEYIVTGNAIELYALLNSNPKLAIQKTSQQISPLLLCCYYKKPELADIILKHVPEISIFEASALGKNDHITNIVAENPGLIHEFSDDGFTPLSLAAYFGNEDVVRNLLLSGADPNIPSKNGFSVYPIHSAVASNYTMIAKMLLEAGADINVVQKSGATPLHSAAHNGNIELLIVLLEAGAIVDAKMEDGKTAADKAFEKGFLEIAKILS